VQHRIRQDSF